MVDLSGSVSRPTVLVLFEGLDHRSLLAALSLLDGDKLTSVRSPAPFAFLAHWMFLRESKTVGPSTRWKPCAPTCQKVHAAFPGFSPKHMIPSSDPRVESHFVPGRGFSTTPRAYDPLISRINERL